MKRKIFLASIWLLVTLGQGVYAASGEPDLPLAWVQYAPAGTPEVRAVVAGERCPLLTLDAQTITMQVRAKATDAFPTECSAVLPRGVKQAFLMPQNATAQPRFLPLPPMEPKRIAVVGDGGCRIKGGIVQECQDGEKWPFARIVTAVAAVKPDLVIHVGDYISREQPCPTENSACQGMPYGDVWAAWAADFFTPAAPLLARSPFVFVRGNHEDCTRSGPGYLRVLGPQPFDPHAPCTVHQAPFFVPLGPVTLAVMDVAAASDTEADPRMVAALRQDFAALKGATDPTWLVLHRPIFAAISGPLGLPVGGNISLIEALGDDRPDAAVRMMLSGHIHSFEVLNYGPEDHMPPQLVAGIGGDELHATPDRLKGTIFQGWSGVRVADGLSDSRFGFVLLTHETDRWRIEQFDVEGHVLRRCLLDAGRIDCPAFLPPDSR